MKFTTILSHCAQLLRIVYKSAKPSDSIASDYFRQKKYIGSKERRFISETLFHCLRNYTLLNHCYSNTLSNLSVNENQNFDEYNPHEFGLVSIAIYLSNNGFINSNHIPLDLYHTLPNMIEEDLNMQISNSLIDYYNIDLTEINKILTVIENKLKNLKIKCDNLSISADLSDELFENLALLYSFQPWIIKGLSGYLNIFEIIKLLDSFNYSAPLIIRINENSAIRSQIIKLLNGMDIKCKETNLSPHGIKIEKRVQLSQLDLFKKGMVEVQEEGSQLISLALAPFEGSSILDACAGAGGKSLHLASLTNDKAAIIATDIDSRKLKELNLRAYRNGFKSIKTIVIRAGNFSKNDYGFKEFDFVLVDAPCSGMGTIRRSPIQKYKVNQKMLERLHDNQINILKHNSQFVKPGGILLYSTCSIMPVENQLVINKFLESNTEFIPSPLSEAFDDDLLRKLNLQVQDYFINLLPSKHETDGFFIARFQRKF